MVKKGYRYEKEKGGKMKSESSLKALKMNKNNIIKKKKFKIFKEKNKTFSGKSK